jgi:YaiO family outer membrane protein
MPVLVAAIYCQACAPQPCAPGVAATDNRDQIYALAVKERLAGDNADAIAQLQTLLASAPDDVDARLQLGLALRAAGRTAEAETELREVLRQAPDYKDARVALAQLQWAHGDAAAAKTTLGPELMGDPGDGDTRELVSVLTAQNEPSSPSKPAPQWRIDASASISDLTDNLPEWKELDVAVSHKLDADSAVIASVQTLERFDIGETYIEAGYDRGWSGGEVSVEVGGSLDPTFRPVFSAHGEAELNPWRGSPWTVDLSGNFSRYVSGDVETGTIGADRLIFGDSGKLSARFIITYDETDRVLPGFSAGGAWRFNPVFDASATYVDAAETDTGKTVRVRSISFAGNVTLNDDAILHATVTQEWRENSFDQLEFALGATAKF